MELTFWKDIKSGNLKYKIEIQQSELLRVKLTDFDMLLLLETDNSGKVSDIILGLELFVRKVEEANA